MARHFFGYDPWGRAFYDPRDDFSYEPLRPKPVRIPVHVVGSEPSPPKKPAMSRSAAAARVQAAARGFLARRMVRAVRAVEREAEEIAGAVEAEKAAVRADTRLRTGVSEALMRLLLRLDEVRGAREYRKKVNRRVMALQDAVDGMATGVDGRMEANGGRPILAEQVNGKKPADEEKLAATVVALQERNARQEDVIGELVKRVQALERKVRTMERWGREEEETMRSS